VYNVQDSMDENMDPRSQPSLSCASVNTWDGRLFFMPPDYTELLVRLQCCHSILNTAWPRPGVPQMAGARRFIATKLFRSLQVSIDQTAESIESLGEPQVKEDLFYTWNSVGETVRYLSVANQRADEATVDRLFNLLYLVTGIAYHRVAGELPQKSQQDERFSSVEDVGDLLRLCAWRSSQPSEQPADLLRELTRELEASRNT
jgi:hypothetical protein